MSFKITRKPVSRIQSRVVAYEGITAIYIPVDTHLLIIDPDKQTIEVISYNPDDFSGHMFEPIYEGELNITIEG